MSTLGHSVAALDVQFKQAKSRAEYLDGRVGWLARNIAFDENLGRKPEPRMVKELEELLTEVEETRERLADYELGYNILADAERQLAETRRNE